MAVAIMNTPNNQILPSKPYPFSQPSVVEEPVKVVGNSVVFNPNNMELNKFYIAQLGDIPYIYRRTSANEVEVYGLAD